MRDFFSLARAKCSLRLHNRENVPAVNINIYDMVQKYDIQIQSKFYTPGNTENIGCKTTLNFHSKLTTSMRPEGVCE